MFNFNDYTIKEKLIIVFIVFKVLPLTILSALGIYSFMEIDKLLKKSSIKIVKQSKNSIKNTTNIVISDSMIALNKKSQSNLEEKTKNIAANVASFLYQRDADILLLSSLTINQRNLQNFYNQKKASVYIASDYIYDEINHKWISSKNISLKTTKIYTNKKFKNFNTIKKQKVKTKLIPLYKEISFYKANGKEIYKISTLSKELKNISKKNNTYLHAEDYFKKAKKLKKGEIYISKVIGEYIASPVIGNFTREKAKKAGIKFEPTKYGYAGKENPLGKKFNGIIRFVTPVYKNSNLQGYLTLAIDHHHIMNFTDFVDPLSSNSLDISDASSGNYAYMWDNDFLSISHPRDYFIMGYNAKTGEVVPPWIDENLAKKFKQNKEKDLNKFLKTQPIFFEQSLDKKPNKEQIRIGQIGIDCKYINFAPICKGWKEVTKDGAHGSFLNYWSNIWKLSAVAPIPYYTGRFKNSKKGFGLITMGANTNEFHKAAIKTKEHLASVLEKEYANIQESIESTSDKIYKSITNQIRLMSFITVILIFVVIYVAILISNNISRRVNKIIIGTQRLKNKNFDYQIKCGSNDELGELCNSFNSMASFIKKLNQGLEEKLFKDDLTGLSSRLSLYKDIKENEVNSLLLFDINSFKNINDYYGTQAGNFILKRFAKVLKEFASLHDMSPYRIGSDEFILLSNAKLSDKQIDSIVVNLSHLIASTEFKSDKHSLNTTISFTCGASDDEKNLIEYADLALNEAKNKKYLYMIYNEKNPNMNKHTEYILWKQKIIYAVENDNIVPYFQPIIDVKNPQNKKYECLIRMIDNGNVISPYMFLNIAKESRLYSKLTEIMIKKTFEIFHHSDAVFSVNISIDDIQNNQTVEFIQEQLERYDVGDRLIFEILESEEISNFDLVLPFIKKMKAKGVRFAIDDFGSGYSNFSYMLQMKPDLLKIDGSLIKNITENSDEYYVVDAIVKFAKSLDIKLVAEFVSTKEILDTLDDFDIDYMQGYYFSEPRESID
ncbi:EAL domain-containing protein [Sulfurimonas sp.]|uniref:EAL domain-containing protein n=1 Tax=Sulfurimonas sp. TaxID=2022749 RepID=UPI002AB15A4E|nr:EAL domain-containing protein [Sulfurimonas sp.]